MASRYGSAIVARTARAGTSGGAGSSGSETPSGELLESVGSVLRWRQPTSARRACCGRPCCSPRPSRTPRTGSSAARHRARSRAPSAGRTSSTRRPSAYAIRFSVKLRMSGMRTPEQRLVQVRRRRERRAVVQLAARVELRAVLAIAQLARHVEVVEREPDRIHELVAALAGRIGAVHLHALARGQLLAVLGAGRLLEIRARSAAAAAAACPAAPPSPTCRAARATCDCRATSARARCHGRAGRGAGRPRTRPCGTCGPATFGNAVVLGEPLVHERRVGREQREHVAIVPHDVLEEQLRLALHRLWRATASKSGNRNASGCTFSRSCSRSHCAAKRVDIASARGSASMRFTSALNTAGSDRRFCCASDCRRSSGMRAPQEEREARGQLEVIDAVVRPGLGLGRRPSRSGRRSTGLASIAWRPSRTPSSKPYCVVARRGLVVELHQGVAVVAP